MKIFKTRLVMSGGIYEMDTIKYQDEFWLVPNWIEHTESKKIKPVRMIPIRAVASSHKDKHGEVYFSISNPMPEDLFLDQVPPEIIKAFRVLENPDLAFDTPAEFSIH